MKAKKRMRVSVWRYGSRSVVLQLTRREYSHVYRLLGALGWGYVGETSGADMRTIDTLTLVREPIDPE